jgi:2-haloalkanoic acid dehalogenase type II
MHTAGRNPAAGRSDMAKPGDYKALTFDCYGTLIDWESGIWDAFQPVLMANECRAITRDRALAAFAELESRQQATAPTMRYEELLRAVHARFAARFGLRTSDDLDAGFGQSIAHWPAFPDTADALRILKTHFRLVILSNVSRAGFAASNRKLGVEFDAIYTAEDIGSYKPAPANFEYLLSHLESDLGLGRTDVLHTAQSLFHDHVPAKQLGLANAWIDRQRLSESGDWGATAHVSERPEVDFLFYSMGEMAQAVEQGT